VRESCGIFQIHIEESLLREVIDSSAPSLDKGFRFGLDFDDLNGRSGDKRFSLVVGYVF